MIIKVISETGGGKSTVMRIIADALRAAGCRDIVVNDPDNPTLTPECISGKLRNLSVEIEHVQAPREICLGIEASIHPDNLATFGIKPI